MDFTYKIINTDVYDPFKVMVRPQKKGTTGITSEEAMIKAVNLVINEGYSLRIMAENCSVKYQTLAKCVEKKR